MGGKRKPDAVIAQRVADAVPRLNAGEPVPDVAEGLNVHRSTIYRNLKKLTDTLNAGSIEERLGQKAVFEFMEQCLLEQNLPAETVREWRNIRSEISKLMGWDAPARTFSTRVTVGVDPTTMGLYSRFLHECRNLMPEQMEDVFQFMRSLPRHDIDMTPPPRMALPTTDVEDFVESDPL